MVQPYFSSARCNPSDRLNRHGRGGCSYVERQKPGNDFDKVTERRPTTRRIKKELLPIVSASHARARKFISATFGHAVNVVFGLRSKADERVPAPRITRGVVKSNVPARRGVAAGALVSRIYEKHTPRSYPRRLPPSIHITHRLVTHIQLIFR